MANEQNLKSLQERTTEEKREIAQKGGKASGEARRRKKDMKERLEILLSMPITKGKETDINKIKGFGELKGKNITVEDAILVAMIQKALKGDVSASNFIRDTSGQKVAEKVEINTTIDDSVREIEKYLKGK
jgi:hypothetical protein